MARVLPQTRPARLQLILMKNKGGVEGLQELLLLGIRILREALAEQGAREVKAKLMVGRGQVLARRELARRRLEETRSEVGTRKMEEMQG